MVSGSNGLWTGNNFQNLICILVEMGCYCSISCLSRIVWKGGKEKTSCPLLQLAEPRAIETMDKIVIPWKQNQGTGAKQNFIYLYVVDY